MLTEQTTEPPVMRDNAGDMTVHRDRRCQAYTVSKEAGYLQSLPGSLQTAEAAVSFSAQLGICIAFAVTQHVDGISCLAWLGVLLALLVPPQAVNSAASCSTRTVGYTTRFVCTTSRN